jgi:ABC-type glycerol-3-phosphate transport system substrate-binding protein
MTSTAHLWYLGWGQGELDAAFDFAPVPSYEGVATAKLHADTFSITSATENPDAAWTVLQYMMDERGEDLLALYGGLPARASLQETFFDTYINGLSEAYPQFDWANMNWTSSWQVSAFLTAPATKTSCLLSPNLKHVTSNTHNSLKTMPM